MIKISSFDYIHDIQNSFRKLMGAFSFPFEVKNIKEEMDKLEDLNGNLLLLALIVADKGMSFSSFGDGELEEKIRTMTYAHVKEEDMDFVFLSLKSKRDIEFVLNKVNPGDLFSPHKSTTLFIEVDKIKSGKKIMVFGPGINGDQEFNINDEIYSWIVERNKLDHEYPMGIELVFVDKIGDLIAVPRKVNFKEGN